MPHIDYFFATISPFTYLAGKRLEPIAEKHGATITYKPINVLELFSRTGGQPPKDRHISRQEYRIQELQRLPKKLGLPLNVKPAFWPTNPAPSSYAIIAAQAGEHGKAFAVVAGQVKTLAQRTTTSTKEIDRLIHSVQQESEKAVHAMEAGIDGVEDGVSRSRFAGDALEVIRSSASEASGAPAGVDSTQARKARISASFGDRSAV